MKNEKSKSITGIHEFDGQADTNEKSSNLVVISSRLISLISNTMNNTVCTSYSNNYDKQNCNNYDEQYCNNYGAEVTHLTLPSMSVTVPEKNYE